jgi:hypothetical protein
MLTQCNKHELVIATFAFYLLIICYCHFNKRFDFHNLKLTSMKSSDLVPKYRLNCNIGD